MKLLQHLVTKQIAVDTDIAAVRRVVKEFAIKFKFNLLDQTKLITAASEISRNTLIYGGGGEFILSTIEDALRFGLHLAFEDKGPGIADIEQALRDGFTGGKGMGLGLGGSKRLVNEFYITSEVNKGTKITLIKWLP